MILLGGPLDFHLAANAIDEPASAFAGHFQAHDSLAALGLVAGALLGRRRHPVSAVEKRSFLLLGGLALRLQLLGRGVVVIGETTFHQYSRRRLIALEFL